VGIDKINNALWVLPNLVGVEHDMDLSYDLDEEQPRNDWSGSSFTRIVGFSFFASLFSNAYIFDSVKLLVLGSLIETGRRLFQWLIERFRFRQCLTLSTIQESHWSFSYRIFHHCPV